MLPSSSTNYKDAVPLDHSDVIGIGLTETNLALPEDTVDLSPAAWCTLKPDARLLEALAESVCSLPAV